MSIDKNWIALENRNSPEFQQGLLSFVEMSKAHVDNKGLIRCPCRICVNNDFKTIFQMKGHIHRLGFEQRYITWVYHGESSTPPVVYDVNPSCQMADVIEDVRGESRENDTNHTQVNFLRFIAKLMHFKAISKWTDTSCNLLLEFLKFAFPGGNKVPSSYYEAKKILKKIGLGYESIHVCKNDCMLLWKEHESLQNCHVCKESRWVEKNKKGKKVAHKKDLDMKYPSFSSEPRIVRLALVADGFNPFGNMSSKHSTWPVILTTYNLPHWLCMKESTFMLTLLIPCPKSTGKDMDVFLQPLVEELKHLWQYGERTKDAATNTFFTIKGALLWSINDFPARSSLSGWSGQGWYKACPTCNKDTHSCRVKRKTAYVGHRRFLARTDPRRKSLEFNGKHKERAAPRQFSEEEILAQLAPLQIRTPGKHPDFGGVKRKREEFELNWSKRSIFFQLEYWSTLQLKHNLDVMHIEKNTWRCGKFENLNGYKKMGNKSINPHAKYSLTDSDRKFFCQFIKDVKLPDSEISEGDTEVSEGEIDENMLRMMMIWYIVLHLMADVMGRGHGGDGAEDPPPPHGRERGQHEMDAVPPQRRRGKAKNLQLTPTWIKNGRRPLPITFDAYTGTTVGQIHDLLIREMSIIISRDIPLNRDGWKKVPASEKNALLQHLWPYFDIDSVMVDPEKVTLQATFETMLTNSYKGQKNNAKRHFNETEGYEDLERARNNPPSNITPENWIKAVDFFTAVRLL
ncbi:hypothetical protein LXL04_024460 [Taraxacum kok-saghyz]